jgi:hypothetical protein
MVKKTYCGHMLNFKDVSFNFHCSVETNRKDNYPNVFSITLPLDGKVVYLTLDQIFELKHYLEEVIDFNFLCPEIPNVS